RAKRTEEERIEYLRADAHVAQFEAYRVLCASCDKWIRLRPNSTFSRRRNAEQRAATLRADVLIREVEPNRVFCSLCAKWVQLRQDSSYCAYPWLQHRGKC
ncbi:hypothetical protein B0H17DRAFT_898564, partial [Mycena rosella]